MTLGWRSPSLSSAVMWMARIVVVRSGWRRELLLVWSFLELGGLFG